MLLQTRVLAALVALSATAVPVATFAQADGPPSYARPGTVPGDEAIHGRIAAVDGAYNLQVNDDRGFVDNVQLQQGTIINPTGIRLTSGMRVTIHGVNRGSVFAANEIDTPYQSYGVAYGYPAYPYPVYPYPAYGYPCCYAYGPTFGIGFGFGFGFHGGGFHGGGFHGGGHR
jgi:hypothetical protein